MQILRKGESREEGRNRKERKIRDKKQKKQ